MNSCTYFIPTNFGESVGSYRKQNVGSLGVADIFFLVSLRTDVHVHINVKYGNYKMYFSRTLPMMCNIPVLDK